MTFQKGNKPWNKGKFWSKKYKEKFRVIANEYWQKPESRLKAKKSAKKVWQNTEYRRKHKESMNKPDVKKKQIENGINHWANPKYKKKQSKLIQDSWNKHGLKKRHSKNLKKIFQTPKYKKLNSIKMKRLWATPEYRKNMISIRAKPKSRKKRGDAISLALNKPEVRKKRNKSLKIAAKKSWQNPVIREKRLKLCQSLEYRKNMKKSQKKAWKNPLIRTNRLNSIRLPETSRKKINTLIEKGMCIPDEEREPFDLYRLKVNTETRKHINKLLKNWNKRCYYTKKLIVNKLKKRKQNKSIDHKISIFYGFTNNISPKIIGSYDNLCLCTGSINSQKNKLCEKEFKIKNKKKNK